MLELKYNHSELQLQSAYLDRRVRIGVYHPVGQEGPLPLLVMLDGQDAARLRLKSRLDSWRGTAPLVIAIPAGNRLREYGTVLMPDFRGRGAGAWATTGWISQELWPFLEKKFSVSAIPEKRALMGFSLSGLMAFDIAFRNPSLFGAAAIFSGSLWWRSSRELPHDPDCGRILPQIIRESRVPEQRARFWFQAGTRDEKADRNQNGVIDAIDDTLHVMEALEQKGWRRPWELHYLEMEKGKHDPGTWGKAIPEFLKWWLTGKAGEKSVNLNNQ